MSNEVQQALDRLFEPTAARRKNPPTSDAAAAEAAELYELAGRLGRLHEVHAPRRLREHGLEFVFAQPVPVRRRHLWLVPPPERRRQVVRAFQQVAASAAAVLVLSFGAAQASSNSLPDSPLYNVRLLTEDVQAALAPADQRPHIYVAQAQRHTAETVALLAQDKVEIADRSSADAERRIDSAIQAAVRTSDPERALSVVQEAAPVVVEVRKQTQERVASAAAATATSQPTSTRASQVAVLPPAEPPTSVPPTSVPEPTPVPQPTALPTTNVAAPGSGAGFTTIDPSGGSSTARPTEPPAVVVAPQIPFVPITGNGDVTAVPTTTSASVSAPAPTFLPIGATATPRPSQSATVSAPAPTVTRTATAPAAPTSSPTRAPASPSPTRTATAPLEAPSNGFTPIVIGPQGSGS